MTVGAKKGGYLRAQQRRFILTKADITNVLNVQTGSNSDNTGPPLEPVLGAIVCLLCAGVLQLTLSLETAVYNLQLCLPIYFFLFNR